MAIRPGYIGREIGYGLRRNLSLFLGTVLVVWVSLSLLGCGLLLKAAVENATARWQDDIEFIVFMNPDAPEPQIESIRSALESSPDVRSFTFFTKDDAYLEFQELFDDSPELIDSIVPDVLPTSFRIVPENPDADVVLELSGQFRSRPGVRAVVSATDAIRDLQTLTNDSSFWLLFISFALGVSALLLVYNTIRTAIFARRREIEVMKLVGASNWYIRLPFMFEGTLQGLVGGAISVLSLYGFNRLLGNIGGNPDGGLAILAGFVVDGARVFTIGIWMILLGALLGAVASGFAITRHLDV